MPKSKRKRQRSTSQSGYKVSYKLRTTIATAKRLRVAPHIEWKNDSKRRMQEEEMSDIFTHMLDDDAALLANIGKYSKRRCEQMLL